jgi:hypothetical protein
MNGDPIQAILEVVVGGLLLLSLSLLLMPPERAQITIRFIKRLLFGDKT